MSIIIAAALIISLASVSAVAFSMPTLLGKSIMPQMFQQSALELPTETITPEEVAAAPADEVFNLRVSGNVYFDKMPVQGAVVTIYLNDRKVGETTAGDIYTFEVPGVRMGDTVRVDATYEGFTGTVSEVVKFKSVSLNVNIDSGRSFIRSALDMLPTKDDISEAEQQQAQQPAQQTATTPSSTSSTPSSTTTSSADASQLTSQIFGNAAKQLGQTAGQSGNEVLNPSSVTTPDTGSGMTIADIQNMINSGGQPGLTI